MPWRKQTAVATTAHHWRNHGVRIVRRDYLDFDIPSWPDLRLGAAIIHASAGASEIWAGAVTSQPKAPMGSIIYMVSGGARMRWGERLE